jgi:hypothetical protein
MMKEGSGMALTAQEQAARDEAAAGYVAIRSAWQKYFKQWYGVHYFLGSLLLVFAALAASATKIGLSEYCASIFSLLVVILTGSIGFYKPEDRASRYRQAWSLLHTQLSRFLYDQTYTLNDVIRAYEQGVLDWRERLLPSPCGSRRVDMVVTGTKRG